MLKSVTLIFFSVFVFGIATARHRRTSTEEPESWTGKWFPERPTAHTPHKGVGHRDRVEMGVPDPKCDDGRTNLTVDWDNSFMDYTCLNPRNRIEPEKSSVPLIEYEKIPVGYEAPHFCMKEPLSYTSDIPTYGPHRPLWARWGTYKYIPRQRWLHNLEHGGIAALYHPCADLRGISILKKLVKSCLRKHIISPVKEIPRDRPFVLVAWGVRMRMSVVNSSIIQDFIRKNALKGPERSPTDGQYAIVLQEEAQIVSDFEDSNLCPNLNDQL